MISYPLSSLRLSTAFLLRSVPWLVFGCALLPAIQAAPVLHQISSTVYQTEHCLFIIDPTVTWASPATAYNDIYGNAPTFPRLSGYFDTLLANCPGNYFSICYIANTGDSHVPNYIDRTFKANGINESWNTGTPFTFATVDFCRYNLPGGNVTAPVLAVYDHELGHAWGARAFYTLTPPTLSDGHWLYNSTVDCQMGASYSPDGGVTVDKLYGDPVNGFRYRKVDNTRVNDFEVFSEQSLYLLGVRETWPTAYVLNNVVFNPDLSAGYSTYDTFDQAGIVVAHGPRSPDYTTSQKHFKIGFVYIAPDLAEVNTVYANVEKSADAFCNGEVIDTVAYRSQTPFLVDTKYRASVDGLLVDLDGNTTPTLTVTDTYVTSTDGTAVVNFTAADPDGPAPIVSVVPASNSCTVSGSTVQVAGLPDGVHFFALKAVDAGGKKVFGHFTVEVHRPITSTVISSQPVPQTVIAGNPVSFSVAASGGPASFTYQWYRKAARTSTWNSLTDGGAYSGSTTATLTIASGTDQDGDEFLCMASNSTGTATSNAAGLVVNETLPTLTTQPANATAASGNSVPFSVVPVGVPATFGYYHYQWQLSTDGGSNWSNLSNGAPYSGCTTAAFRVVSNISMTGNQFRCLVTNTAGTVTSNAASLTVGLVPVVTTQPVPATATAGQGASFTVVVSGTGPLTYLWSLYSTPVPGGTGPTLTLTNVQASDVGAYSVYVTNAYGSTRSNVGTLTVTPAAPTFTTQPQTTTIETGQAVSFTATTSGTSPFTYQWKKNGVTIAGATGATYSIAHVTLTDAGTYTVVVTNSVGHTTSSGAVLTVTAIPADDFNNDNQSDIVWQNTTSGDRGFWLMNGTAYAGWVDIGAVTTDWRIAATADFNGDGQPDLLWENTTTGDRGFWLMNGTTFASWVDLGYVSTVWRIAGAADFNGDGKADILWENTSTGDRGFWLMNGTAFASWVDIGAVTTDWRIAAVGDFNGDGKADVVWENTTTGDRGFWLMNGTNFSSWVDVGVVSTNWRIAAVGDYNGDGKTDILWENTTSGDRGFWLMNGTAFASWQSIGIISTDWRIAP